MKGIVFAEFLDLVESKFGLAIADDIISKSQLPSGGAYTGVGTYDHHEILTLVTALSQTTSLPVRDLVKAFGGHLLQVFVKKYGGFFVDKNTFTLLMSIDNFIHVEVKKLYPDAELPRFSHSQPNPKELHLQYRSTRPFSDLAEGLIEATIKHFGESIELTCVERPSNPHCERDFILRKK